MSECHPRPVNPVRSTTQPVPQNGDAPTAAEIVAERLRLLEAFVAEHGLTYWDGQYGVDR